MHGAFELLAINAKPKESFSSVPMRNLPTNKMKEKEYMFQDAGGIKEITLIIKEEWLAFKFRLDIFPLIDKHY